MLLEWNGSYLALRKNGVNSLIIEEEKKMVLCNTNMHIRLEIKIKLHRFFFFFKAV